ncbi:hypothetical protein ACKKBG_A16795 [Auxenochlorella protothecoides x Auxenochlorella symbiontica]
MSNSAKPLVAWASDEARRFFRAFHKYGTEFDKVSRAVGSGRSPEQCEALHRQHQAFLSLDKKFQSEIVFIAMVEDASQHLMKTEDSDGKDGRERSSGAGNDASDPGVGSEATPAPSSSGQKATGAASGSNARGGDADADSVLRASEAGSGAAQDGAPQQRTLASTRARRTPRPSVMLTPQRTPQRARAPAGRTPASSGKRSRAARAGDDIYDYHDAEAAAAADSARKRRTPAGQKRLDFGFSPSGRRRDAADEQGGIDALLALAVAGTEGEAGRAGLAGEGVEQPARGVAARAAAAPDATHLGLLAGLGGAASPALSREASGLEEEEEEEDDDVADAGAIEAGDETDDDYLSAGGRRRGRGRAARGRGRRTPTRRTPASTPGRPRSRGAGVGAGGGPGPAGGASTPSRRVPRPLASPGSGRGTGLGGASPMPAWMALAESDLLGEGDLSNLPDLGYLTSPGLAAFPPGHVASPAHPMPRLRRRKFAPERSPPMVSPIKSLFARRQSLGAGAGGPAAALLGASGLGAFAAAGAGGAGGPSAGEDGAGAAHGAVMSPLEVRLRHALTAHARRWCAHEFFVAAPDRCWLEAGGAGAVLATLGLPRDAALTWREWAALRAGLGRPRRLSLRFLHEQRAALEAWREAAREAAATASRDAAARAAADRAAAGAAGAFAGPGVAGASPPGPGAPAAAAPLPAAGPSAGLAHDAGSMPRALGVGQRVTARHPATRQLHDGAVLTVAPTCVRVQFDRRELGVELVRDTDVAPADPAENLPPAYATQPPERRVLNGRLIVRGKTVNVEGRAPGAAPSAAPSVSEASNLAPAPAVPGTKPPYYVLGATPQSGPGLPAAALCPAPGAGLAGGAPALSAPGTAAPGPPPHPPPPGSTASVRPQAAAAALLSELTMAMHKKEALVAQLNLMNDEAAAGVHTDSAGGAQNPGFVRAFASVIVQLKAVSDRIFEKLQELRDDGGPGGAGPDAYGPAPRGDDGGGEAQGPALSPADLAPEALAAASLEAAERVVEACRGQLAGGARRSGQATGEGGEDDAAGGGGDEAPAGGGTRAGAGGDAGGDLAAGPSTGAEEPASPDAAAAAAQRSRGGVDWGSASGRRLTRLIQSCVQTLLLLQRGTTAPVPMAALAAALDVAIAGVRPHAPANEGLLTEVRGALSALKSQILAPGAGGAG